jgi:hypothetical protein
LEDPYPGKSAPNFKDFKSVFKLIKGVIVFPDVEGIIGMLINMR